MDGSDFLVDTNILIYGLEGSSDTVLSILNCSIAVSIISEIELLGKKNITSEEVTVIQNLLNDCTIIDLNDKIKQIAIRLIQIYSLKVPDAIIAASSIYTGLPFVSCDTAFKKVKELDLVHVSLY
ncbi:MAG: type II toxin-antitoxin system VapC family toxin [Tannerellaceae bacterium]|jgi:predicted nucleic acid-binding protein|nr:type II toxin-antitoxin system VapC family toxin [Tannerellaceae bacterium]